QYFDKETCKALKSLVDSIKPNLPMASTKAILYCKSAANKSLLLIMFINRRRRRGRERRRYYDEHVKDLALHVHQYSTSVSGASGASFTEKYIMPAIRRVLLKNTNENIVYVMIDKPDDSGKKPDFMIGSRPKKKEFYFFFVEIKRSDITSKHRAEDEFTKILKQMKDSADKALCLGVKGPVSLGLLFKSTVFQMKLVVGGIYLPTAIKRFLLVEEVHELVHLPSIVEVLFFL
ncbi:hypothetical protein BCV71DRAFT_179465, partial [Rhizopus microsporus]